MSDAEQNANRVEAWMRAAINDLSHPNAYDRAFDLAVDCTSDNDLYDDDFEIPQYIIEIALKVLPCIHNEQHVHDRSIFICSDCGEEIGR